MLNLIFSNSRWLPLADNESWWDPAHLDGESGLYLLGTTPLWWGGGVRHVYVGRSRNLRDRLKRHAQAKSHIGHLVNDATRYHRIHYKVLRVDSAEAVKLERMVLDARCLPWNTQNAACTL